MVLVLGLPLGTLLSQAHQLSAADAHLASVRQENRQLAQEESQLSSKAEIERRARQDYQLVEPGQTLYELLPGPTTRAGLATSSSSGDPGNQPLVSPSRAPDLAPDPGLPSAPPPDSRGASNASGRPAARANGSAGASGTQGEPTPGFWSRVSKTLEFWE